MNDLFRSYARAFDCLNPSYIAGLYTFPCSTSDSDGSQVYPDRESLIDKFEENCRALKAMGYQTSEFNILTEVDMGENAKAVTVGWRVKTINGVLEFRSMYVCHKKEYNWLIFSANVYPGEFNSSP